MSEKQRTAVLLSGLPREVDETWRSWANLLGALPNPDIFIYSSQYYTVGPEFYTSILPKKYKVENQWRHTETEQKIKNAGFYDNDQINSCIQQFYGIKRVWELKEDYEKEMGIKYDLVVRTRPDFIWLRPINLDWLELDKISNLHANFSPTVCSEFAIGPNDLMEKYCKLFDCFSSIGEQVFLNTNPRLSYSNGLYNTDVVLTVYLYDHLKLQTGTNERIPMDFHSPYDYYRIMFRHKRNLY